MNTEVAVGMELPEQVFQITRADLIKYAGASGDFNPIHWDSSFAKSVGLPDVIAHGMYTMALVGKVVTDWAGADKVRSYQVRFAAPIVVPEQGAAELRVSGKVTALNEDGTIRVDLAAYAADQKVLGQARALVATW